MDHYITGRTVKNLRKKRNMAQAELADAIGVSAKTVSKWETMRGLPDITLIEPLAQALGISVTELFAGEPVINQNISSNMLRSKLYVCPLCGNVIHGMGESVVSCCGITLPVLTAEECDEMHKICLEHVENEHYIRVSHEMTKEHYISFLAYVTSDKFEMIKLYPEGNAEARFLVRGHGFLYMYCNRHGLMKTKI